MPTSSFQRQRGLNLWVHNDSFSKQDVVFNLHAFPGVHIGDFVELSQLTSQFGRQNGKTRTYIFQVTPETVDEDLIAKQAQLQVSVTNHIATAFMFQSRTPVIARRVDEVSVTADHVELSFRDQYIGRSDMWRFSQAMVDTCVYEGKNITFAGVIRAQVKGIYINGQQHASGYISETTKAIFRSESSKFFIFIQMCQEMWEFDEDGEIFYEKAVNGFLPELFARWKKLNTNHVVSIVLFTRIYYDERDTDKDDPTLVSDHNERWYRDFYKVVVNMETSSDWMTYTKQLKTEVLHFQRDILLKGDEPKVTLAAQNAYAFQGNILEAINLALNSFDEHYVDRDLLRTGLSIIVITPGTGQFQVNKKLLRLTTERMIDNGIGLDLVCLSKVPLHTVPLFKFPAAKPPMTKVTVSKGGRMDLRGMDREITPDTRDPLYYDGPDEQSHLHMYYAMPHWIDASFYSRNQDQPFKSDRFITRCKMYEVQMMGIMEHEIASIAIPLLQEDPNFWSDVSSKSLRDDKYQRYDAAVYKTTIVPSMPEKLSGNIVKNGKGNGLHVDPSSSRPKQVPLVSELSRSLRSDGFGNRKLLTAQSDFDDTQERLASIKLVSGEIGDLNPPNASESEHPQGINIERPQSEEFPEDAVFGSSTVKPISIRTAKNVKLPRNHPRASPASLHSFEDTVFKWDENAGRVPRLLNNSGPSPGHNSPGRQGYKQTLINPSNPDKSNIPVSSQLRRWHHVFPKTHTGKSVRWKSMCTPACLPLSTDYFPSAEDLSNHFQEYTYTISIDPDATSAYPGLIDLSPASLLTEMLSQRLAQGFQLIVGDSVNAHAKKSGPTSVTRGFSISDYKPIVRGTSRAMYNVVQGIDNAGTAPPVYLFMSHHFHRLLYDPAGQNVEVKRYVQKLGYTTLRTRYSCVIWPKSTEGYRLAQTSFAYPDVASYNWNYMDQLIAGYQDDIIDSLKVWKTRFVLVPTENVPQLIENGDKLEDEEVRVSGIFKFHEIFQKAKWVAPGERQVKTAEESEMGLTLRFTTLCPSAYVSNEVASVSDSDTSSIDNSKQDVAKDEGLNRHSPLKSIAAEMAHPTNGVKMEDRRWHFTTYKNVFAGYEYVDWLLKQFSDVNSRKEAEDFGNQLMEDGLFEHCNRRHRFMDGQYFYYLRSEFAPVKPAKYWFSKRTASDTSSISSNATASTNRSARSEDTLRDRKPKLRIEMTTAMTIDVDPNHRSTRPETAFLHYDKIYNPDGCYHFHLHWLGTTARFVEDTVQSWSRTADKYGLKLVEVPVNQVKTFDNDNPFQSPVLIKLACMPPTLASVGRKMYPGTPPELYFEIELVKKFKFLLDVEADDRFRSGDVDTVYSYRKPKYERSQYLHRSGVAMIQVQEAEKGLLWVHNRLYTSHISASERQNQKQMAAIPNVTALRYEFIDFCADKEKLQAFWDEQVELLPHADSNEKTDGIAEAITEALDEKESL